MVINEVERSKEEEEEEIHKLLKVNSPGVDSQARWIKKSAKSRYGYKKHCVTDLESLVLGVLTTAVNLNEISNLEEVMGLLKKDRYRWFNHLLISNLHS